jgi:hypothetical protein
MKKNLQSILFGLIIILFSSSLAKAQYMFNSDSAFVKGRPMTGHLWGYSFGDYYYKAHSDSQNRGGSNQYTGIPADRNAFQLRRVYLGYDTNISQKFSTELLLAAEDNSPAFNPPSSTTASGDQLSNGKLAFYIKLANIRWKNIYNGADLVVGQVSTPGFAMMSEKIWAYRSIERTITDIRRTPSYDLGATLQGTFDPKTKNFGYNVMVGNGSSAKPESDKFKAFYGDVWAKFLDKKVILDFYADYQRLNWTTNYHHSRNMYKLFAAYSVPAFTIGFEGFINNLQNDLTATYVNPVGGQNSNVLNNQAAGFSLFVHGNIIKDKVGYFARYDAYNPINKIDNNQYKSYTSATGNYNDNGYILTTNPTSGSISSATPTGDETSKQQFITAGLDFTPIKNVHIMPNIWYVNYNSQLANVSGTVKKDHDMVYRMTFYYTFGK